VDIVPVSSRSTLQRFIRLPARLFRDDPCFVPQLTVERRQALTPKHNPYFLHADAMFWLARRNGQDVGRITAQRDRLVADEGLGHFGLLAAIDDEAVFSALLRTAEDWLKNRGLHRVRGPFSLSINEETGLLVDGFDTPPMLMMPHDPPYADLRLREQGYAGVRDLFAYLCDTSAALPPSAAALVARGLPRNVTLRPLRKTDLVRDVSMLVEIFNDAWSGNWGFVPITEEEVAHMAKSIKPILHERLVWFAEVDGVAAACGLCLPNLNEAIRDLGGALLPLGWAKLLWRLKRGLKTARVPLMGVRRSHADGMLGRLLPLHVVEALRREALAMGIESVEMSWVLDINTPMRHLAEAVGGRPYKTYRLYEKQLS